MPKLRRSIAPETILGRLGLAAFAVAACASCEAPAPEDAVAVAEQRATTCEHPTTATGTEIKYDRNGLGSGAVISNPGGGTCAPPCSAFVGGASATLLASPAPGSRFAGWTRDCLSGGNGTCMLSLAGQARNGTPIFTRLAASGQIFDDVPGYRADYRYVNQLQEMAITNGTSVTPPMFSPDAPLTRGQMAVFIVRAKNLALPNPSRGLRGGSPDNFDAPDAPYFTDVPRDHLFFKHIQKLRELGITGGYGDGRYGPDDPIPQWQMAVFVTRAAFGEDFTASNQAYFTDYPPVINGQPTSAFKYVQKSADDGVECGCGGGRLCADATVTRGQMATQITRRFFGAPRCYTVPPPVLTPLTYTPPLTATCGNGICEAGENGATCGQDCCDAQTACGQTYRNLGQQYCRDLRTSFQWQGYRWMTQAAGNLACDDTNDRSSANLAVCAGQAHACCWQPGLEPGTWVSGTSCP